MRCTIYVISLCLLSPIVTAAPAKVTKEIEAARIMAVKMLVSSTLKDPDSARFRGVKAKWGTVCGEVNAKNSYGGYVGYRRFYAIDGSDFHMESDNFIEDQWTRFCGPNAKKPEPPAPFHEQWIEQ